MQNVITYMSRGESTTTGTKGADVVCQFPCCLQEYRSICSNPLTLPCCSVSTVFSDRCEAWVLPRLLHPQHLDGVWIGLIQYRLPYAPLSEGVSRALTVLLL